MGGLRVKVFFETLTPWHRPWVAWHLARGNEVCVFDFTRRLKSLGWVRRLLLEGKIQRIYSFFSRADGMAIDAAEWLYPRLSGHPLIRRLQDLFGREESDAVFKSALAESLARYFFIRLHLESLAGTGNLLLVSESFSGWDPLLRAWCQDRLKPLSGVSVPPLAQRTARAISLFRGIRRYGPVHLATGSYILYGWLRRFFGSRRPGPQPEVRVRYLYTIASAFQARFSGPRRFDFLLDHRLLTRENTAFFVDLPDGSGPAEKIRREGCRVLRRTDYSSGWALLARPPKSLDWGLAAKAAAQAAASLFAPEWLQESALRGLQVLLRESPLLERVQFDHYLYANQYGLIPRWRNALIRKAGRQSWWFAYSNGGGFLFWKDGVLRGDHDFGGRHHYWAYQNADHYVSPCAPLIAYHREHRQRIRHYHDVGNLWSELVLREGALGRRGPAREEWFGASARGCKVIGWFDTTFIEAPGSPSTVTEGISWYQDILRLANERPDLRMVIKPSKDQGFYTDESPNRQWSVPSVGRKLMKVWDDLKVHPRVRLLKNSEDPCWVVAGSDLTVTFCFSAVSAEALGAGKKGIWYEPGERWRETFLGKDPLLTAHGYEELRALVQKMLGMTPEEHRAYLEAHARGPVDSFLDGQGLSRFRALLAGLPVGSPAIPGAAPERAFPAEALQQIP